MIQGLSSTLKTQQFLSMITYLKVSIQFQSKHLRHSISSLSLEARFNPAGLSFMQIYATEDGETKPLWKKIVGHILVLDPENYGHIDWSRCCIVCLTLETSL